MASPVRAPIPDSAYLVTQAALEHRTLFRGDRDRFVYLALARRAAMRFRWQVLGYCLLEERTHLVVQPDAVEELDAGVRWVRRAYSGYLRTDRGDRRRLWQSGYGLHRADGPVGWRTLACIELEPVRMGLADDVAGYPWSSGCAHLGHGRPYLPLALERWQVRFGAAAWREYLESSRGELDYWQVLRWVLAPEFTTAARVRTEDAALQSEPTAAQPCLSFGA